MVCLLAAPCVYLFVAQAILGGHTNLYANLNDEIRDFYVIILYSLTSGPDLGGPGGPGPQASHQQGVSHQTPLFLKPRNSIANPGLHNFCYHLCIVK